MLNPIDLFEGQFQKRSVNQNDSQMSLRGVCGGGRAEAPEAPRQQAGRRCPAGHGGDERQLRPTIIVIFIIIILIITITHIIVTITTTTTNNNNNTNTMIIILLLFIVVLLLLIIILLSSK